MQNDIELVEFEEKHLEMVRIWRQSDEVSKYMYTNVSVSPEEQLEWFDRVKDDNSKEHFIIRYDGKDLGFASIVDIDHTSKKCNWGFYLGDTSIRGQGIGSKVEFNIIKYVFDTLDLNRLEGEVFASNENVLEMHAKFGFKQEGHFREYIQKDGEYHDVISIALLKSDWKLIEEDMFNKIYKDKVS